MKILKKVSCFVLTLAMLATIVSVPDAAYAATTKDTVSAKIRIYSGIYDKLDIENPIIRINTAFKGCSSLEKISVLPRIYHN